MAVRRLTFLVLALACFAMAACTGSSIGHGGTATGFKAVNVQCGDQACVQ